MPLHKATIQTGINQQWTQSLNNICYWAGNLIRFRDGMVEKIGGWAKLFSTQLSGKARSLHAFEDLATENNLLIGTDNGPQVYVNGVLYNFDFVVQTSNLNSATAGWSLAYAMGSPVITVTDTLYSPTVGQQVYIGIPVNGMWVGGPLYPQVVTVTGVNAMTNTWTFNNPLGNSASNGDAVTPFAVAGNEGSLSVEIQFGIPGLAPGDIFQVNYPFNFQNGPNVPAGNYVVNSVSGSNFYITAQSPAPAGNPDGRESPDGSLGDQMVLSYLGSIQFPSFVDWYTDNFGGTGLYNYTAGGIYQYNPPISPLAGVGLLSLITNAPLSNNGILVAMPQAQIIAWGSTISLSGSQQDPLLIRWCDAGDDTDWTASTTNQAGSFRLSRGSKIVGGLQIALTTLIFTDTDVWSMQYIGPPFVYSFNIMASGCGLIAPKALTVLGGTAYWMSQKQFYQMGSGGAQVIPCPVWDIIFNDIDQDNLGKINMGANSGFGEILIFWPSASSGTGEIDSYAIFKPSTGEWSYGSDNSSPGCSKYARTAWLDQSVFGSALGGDLNSYIQQHETSYDADGSPMTGAYVETGYASVDPDGDNIMLLTEVEPDFKWFGNVPGAIMLTVKGVNYSQGTPVSKGPYGIDMQNRKIRPRMRKRFIALRWDWFPRLGFNGRLGAIRLRAQPSGRRP